MRRRRQGAGGQAYNACAELAQRGACSHAVEVQDEALAAAAVGKLVVNLK